MIMQDLNTGNRKTRAAETKEKIYRSADLLFREFGFENISVDSIVEKAQVSKGSFYVHFDSKDALIAAYIADKATETDVQYKDIIDSFPAATPVSVIILSLAEAVARHITDDFGHALMKNAYLIQINKNLNYDLLLCYNRELYGTIVDLIRQGIERGEFKTDDSADTLADDFVSTMRGFICEWITRFPDFDLSQRIKRHLEIYLAGLLSENRR